MELREVMDRLATRYDFTRTEVDRRLADEPGVIVFFDAGGRVLRVIPAFYLHQEAEGIVITMDPCMARYRPGCKFAVILEPDDEQREILKLQITSATGEICPEKGRR